MLCLPPNLSIKLADHNWKLRIKIPGGHRETPLIIAADLADFLT
jgi:hypothetical protein